MIISTVVENIIIINYKKKFFGLDFIPTKKLQIKRNKGRARKNERARATTTNKHPNKKKV